MMSTPEKSSKNNNKLSRSKSTSSPNIKIPQLSLKSISMVNLPVIPRTPNNSPTKENQS